MVSFRPLQHHQSKKINNNHLSMKSNHLDWHYVKVLSMTMWNWYEHQLKFFSVISIQLSKNEMHVCILQKNNNFCCAATCEWVTYNCKAFGSSHRSTLCGLSWTSSKRREPTHCIFCHSCGDVSCLMWPPQRMAQILRERAGITPWVLFSAPSHP